MVSKIRDDNHRRRNLLVSGTPTGGGSRVMTGLPEITLWGLVPTMPHSQGIWVTTPVFGFASKGSLTPSHLP